MKSVLITLSNLALFSLLSLSNPVHGQRASGQKCHGLALASGKSQGPYQAGAIIAMLEDFTKSDSFNGTWDAISGVSEGAFNAYLLALQENEASTEDVEGTVDKIKSFWEKVGEEKVYGQHTFGVVEGLVMRDGLYRAEPMNDLIDAEFGQGDLHQKNSKRALNIGVANLMNGTFVSFNDRFKTRDILHALKASAVYPGIFEPFEAWNTTWLTGSSVWNIDVAAPVIRCKAMGFAEEDIVIDAVLDDATDLPKVNVSGWNAFHIGIRSYEVMNYYSARKALLNAQIAYPSVTFRHVVGPKSSWREWSLDQIYRYFFQLVPVEYGKHEVQKMMKKGYEEAKEQIEQLQGAQDGPIKYLLDVKSTFYRSQEEL